ncbi:MAG: hypothetical protein ACK5LJ_07075 [Paracoccus sp. (in: a-proteobacteria)]
MEKARPLRAAQLFLASDFMIDLDADSAAALFRVSGCRTVQKWWGGERGIPGPVVVLTEALMASKSVRNFFGLELADEITVYGHQLFRVADQRLDVFS